MFQPVSEKNQACAQGKIKPAENEAWRDYMIWGISANIQKITIFETYDFQGDKSVGSLNLEVDE